MEDLDEDLLSPREQKLPVWARNELLTLRARLSQARSELAATQEAHAILKKREWFTVHGPPPKAETSRGFYYLFYLSPDGAHPACSLNPGDVILVGRATRENDA